MFSFKYDDDVSLSLPLPDQDSEALYALVEDSRTTLSQWLPWADQLRSADDEKQFLKTTLTHFGTGDSLFYYPPSIEVHHIIYQHSYDRRHNNKSKYCYYHYRAFQLLYLPFPVL